jgi:hypothetical protein
MFKKYFNHTPKRAKQLSLAWRGLIGTIAGATYVQASPKAAFWVLVAGAVGEFLIQCQTTEPRKKRKTPRYVERVKVIIVLLSIGSLMASCGLSKRTVNKQRQSSETHINQKTDSTAVKATDSTGSTKVDSSSYRKADSTTQTEKTRKADTTAHTAADTSQFQFVPGKDTTRFNTPYNNIAIYPNGDGSYTFDLVNKPKEVKLQVDEKETTTKTYTTSEAHHYSKADTTHTRAKEQVQKATETELQHQEDNKGKRVEQRPVWGWYIGGAVAVLLLLLWIIWRFIKWRREYILKGLEKAKNMVYGDKEGHC